MLTTIAVKAVVSIGGFAGIVLDSHDKGLIAGVALFLALTGDAVLAHMHLRKART